MTITKEIARHPGLAAGAKPVVSVRLLATSDLHAHLFPFDYFRDQRDDRVGLVQAADVIDRLRQGHPNTLLFDNGDLLQGAPLGEASSALVVSDDRCHPMIATMNALGYDAATLGNHDFDFGLEVLDKVMSQARHPVVLSNATRDDGPAVWSRNTILDRDMVDSAGSWHRIRVGVVGVAPPQTVVWNRHVLQDKVVMDDMILAVRREQVALERAGADLVVVLAHSGLGHRSARCGAEDTALALAHLPGVDAVVAGHTHAVVPRHSLRQDPANEAAPVVQPGSYGSHIGLIDLRLQCAVAPTEPGEGNTTPVATGRPGTALWTAVDAKAATHPVFANRPDSSAAFRRVLRRYPALKREMAQDHRATRAFTTRPLGRTAVPLHSYFSMLGPCSSLAVVADAQRKAAEVLLRDQDDLGRLPLLSAVAPFRAGGSGGPSNYTDIPAGPLLLRHAADLYIYPNSFTVVRATGAMVLEWLERAAGAFRQVHKREADAPSQPLLDPDFASYNFDCLDGLQYRFDLTQPSRCSADGERRPEGPGRVRDVCLSDGTPVHPEQEFLIATNSYRAQGGGHFSAAARAEVVLEATEPLRDIVATYISDATAPLHPIPLSCWQFVPMAGTPVHVDIGPDILGHTQMIADMRLSPVMKTPGGFQRFQMHI